MRLPQKEFWVSKAEKIVPKEPNAIQRYARETVGELRKVHWPTREETLKMTGVVIAVLVVMSTFLGLLDVLLARLFGLILGA
jgi:preprotein translocase subunit SecE